MKNSISRRDFFRRIGLGTIGLGFGVSIFDGIYAYAETLSEDEKYRLLMKGTVNFKGFMAKEITPNDEFYITSYSDQIPDIDLKTFDRFLCRGRLCGQYPLLFITLRRRVSGIQDEREAPASWTGPKGFMKSVLR